MFLPTYYISVLVVTLGGSTQFYNYGKVAFTESVKHHESNF